MAEAIDHLLSRLGPEVEDPEEEAFLLFSQDIPSQNLGFVDSKATDIDITINGQDLTITQSPAVLSSNRAGGTTGAVVWKVTPLFASWLASPDNSNILFRTGILNTQSTILELGCGVSALVALALAPLVARYMLSDQAYVARFVEQNLAQNRRPAARQPPSRTRAKKSSSSAAAPTNISFHPLDWETDVPAPSLAADVVVACDCIYNDALIPPFVQTCVDACGLRVGAATPTVCIVAQQLRSPDIFEAWLREFCAGGFRVWRVPDKELPEGLRSSSGFVVHVGILRDSA